MGKLPDRLGDAAVAGGRAGLAADSRAYVPVLARGAVLRDHAGSAGFLPLFRELAAGDAGSRLPGSGQRTKPRPALLGHERARPVLPDLGLLFHGLDLF